MTLMDRWQWFDLASLGGIRLLLLRGIRSPDLQYSRNLAVPALFLLGVFLLIPGKVFGSGGADMRLIPYVFALAILALRLRRETSLRHAAVIAVAGLGFFLVRTGATTASLALYSRDQDRELEALPWVPVGGRLLTFVGGMPCPVEKAKRNLLQKLQNYLPDYYTDILQVRWTRSRLYHLPGIALERRLAYANDVWTTTGTTSGGQLLTARYHASGFDQEPSEVVFPDRCPPKSSEPGVPHEHSIAQGLAAFPRDRFDYVWLIRPPQFDPYFLTGLKPIWRGGSEGTSGLYRVDHSVPGPMLPDTRLKNKQARGWMEINYL
jgi:hypothetical protein